MPLVFLFSIPAVRWNRGIGSGTLAGSPASLHSLAGISGAVRTPFRRNPDTIPVDIGRHSKTARTPFRWRPKSVRFRSERCPTSIGTVSGLDRVQMRVTLRNDFRVISWRNGANAHALSERGLHRPSGRIWTHAPAGVENALVMPILATVRQVGLLIAASSASHFSFGYPAHFPRRTAQRIRTVVHKLVRCCTALSAA